MEQTKLITKNKDFKINLIYSHGEVVDNLVNDTLEIGYLLKGKAQIILATGEIINLVKGSFFEIKPNLKHKVINLSKKSLWLTIHYLS